MCTRRGMALYSGVGVSVCRCVCERERTRERQRDRERGREYHKMKDWEAKMRVAWYTYVWGGWGQE